MVGSWRIAESVGAGGMGRVYRARHPEIGAEVAIKVLSAAASQHPSLVERFFAEARAVNLIQHENIVSVLDLGRMSDGRPYIVMELLRGASLGELVARGPLPFSELAAIGRQILAALAAAHAAGVVHRDLKPDN